MNIKDLHNFPHKNFQWIQKIHKVLECLNDDWRFVGGCVRDSLNGISVTDIDITTLLTADEVEKRMSAFTLNVIGKKFGTIGVFYKGFSIEITTARLDIKTYGRSADVNFHNVTFQDDSNRRDFTINALMLDINGNIYDYHNGLNHLQNGIVEFVGDAHIRIQEDYLRLLRYIRFFVRFNKLGNFQMDLVKIYVHKIIILSKERIIKEMESMCNYDNTHYAFELLNECGISEIFWKNKLYTNISDSLNKYEKFTYAIWPFYHLKTKIPLNHHIQYLIGLRKPDSITDIYIHCAFLWNKYKKQNVVEDYIKIHKYFYNEDIQLSFNLNTECFYLFEGITRGKIEFLARYYCLKNIYYDYHILNENQNIFNHIKQLYIK